MNTQEEKADGPHVLISGGMVEGFDFIGPFATHAELEAYADDTPLVGSEWQSAPLENPAAYAAKLAAFTSGRRP